MTINLDNVMHEKIRNDDPRCRSGGGKVPVNDLIKGFERVVQEQARKSPTGHLSVNEVVGSLLIFSIKLMPPDNIVLALCELYPSLGARALRLISEVKKSEVKRRYKEAINEVSDSIVTELKALKQCWGDLFADAVEAGQVQFAEAKSRRNANRRE